MAIFKTRARALDLLGRQQIAGIPTAVNELFKNAHDAYADDVEVDFFRKEGIFVLRDNGLGMTRNDFESRWLTLGTESKSPNSKIAPPPINPNKERRPMMGEKGIGRLAIASIGRQVLILTKADRGERAGKIVAAFINWTVFELPGLNLEDVFIPMREFDRFPDGKDVQGMTKELIDSLRKLVKDEILETDSTNKIISEVKSFDISPLELNSRLIGDFSLTGEKSGTHFYISAINESLAYDIDGEKEKGVSTKIEKMLLGFTNTMTPGHRAPRIRTAFRDYKNSDGTYKDLFNKENFFTPEDFSIADHHFSGTFDEFGQFDGKVNIYQTEEFNHKIPWSGNNFKPTDCGSFKINIAYLQGDFKQSIVESEGHNRLLTKTNKHGGLYLYKDNIRILPYGNSDYDWLDIERNRTKSASFYFFSFRRMFGVIDISSIDNNSLNEKAGREGFIENKAYRQFRDILKNFFIQLAADFFREGSSAGPKADVWVKIREARKSYYQALERRDKQAKFRKEKFQLALNRFFDDLSQNRFQKGSEEIMSEIEKNFVLVSQIDDPDEASQKLIDVELESRQLIENFSQKLKLGNPRGFTISKETRRDFEAYLTEFESIQSEIINKAKDKIDYIVEDYATRLQIETSKRKRLEVAVDFISQQAEKATRLKQRETKDALAEVTKNVSDLARELMIDLENKIRDIKMDFKKYEINNSADFDLVTERKRIEDVITKERDKAGFALESIIKQLQGIYWNKDDNDSVVTSDQIADAMSEELEELKERLQTDIELSQLGLAVGVIQHEFNSTITSIRDSLRDLKVWADVNEKLDGVYNNIRINFEHLDGYLTLFTPLNRRLYRSKEDIPANEIKIFLMDLFGARLERHNIQFKHTAGFRKKIFNGYRSTYYPVFVNIIDNAIHWLNQSSIPEKTIRLHADETGFYISNNGPEISPRDSDVIFNLGFTRKLNGRGMGLHISREVLQADNYTIVLDTPREGSTVTFKVQPLKK